LINENKEKILSRYIKQFVDNSFSREDKIYGGINLMWCNFKRKDGEYLPIDCLNKQWDASKKVLYYDERTNYLFESSFFEICEKMSQLEPWDEIDALIFDETFTWTIAITHEDFLICISEENAVKDI
jgi:hypothetical protein